MILDRFLREAASRERPQLTSRLAANLEIEAMAGRARTPSNRMAARVWLALAEPIVPFHEIPYVQALGARAVAAIAQNLDLGYRTQRAANEAQPDACGR